MSILGDTLANSKTDVGYVIVSYMNALTSNGKHCILQGYFCFTALFLSISVLENLKIFVIR